MSDKQHRSKLFELAALISEGGRIVYEGKFYPLKGFRITKQNKIVLYSNQDIWIEGTPYSSISMNRVGLKLEKNERSFKKLSK